MSETEFYHRPCNKTFTPQTVMPQEQDTQRIHRHRTTHCLPAENENLAFRTYAQLMLRTWLEKAQF
jgi:hypothetical protein